jgi:hypothetical protein
MAAESKPELLAQVLIRGLTAAAALSFFASVWRQLSSVSFLGTARAPHSDALVHWLQGALGYYFHHTPIHHLYRPTIGLLYSSALTSFGSLHIHWLPALFALFLLALLTFFIFVSEPLLVASVGLWLLFSTLQFGSAVAPLNIGSLNVDFFSFVVTLASLLLLVLAFSGTPVCMDLACVAFFLVGLAAVVRGPMIFGGAALLLEAIYLLYRNKQRWSIALIGGCFLLPLVVEWSIQKAYGTKNNGVICLFCFYADPKHGWTKEGGGLYWLQQPANSEVFSRYIHYLFSADGIATASGYFAQRFQFDASLLVSRSGCVALLLAVLAVFWKDAYRRTGSFPLRGDGGVTPHSLNQWIQANPVTCVRLFFSGLLLILMALFPRIRVALAACLLVGMVVISARLRLYYAFAFLANYIVSLLFLSVLGLTTTSRLASTISFCLPLGLYFFLLQEPAQDQPVRNRRALSFASIALTGLLLWLYAGNFLIGTQTKRVFRAQVEDRSAAIKISNDSRLNRSLYYTGHDRLLYTNLDPTPVGTVRFYDAVLTPSGQPPARGMKRCANESFSAPVKFIGGSTNMGQ